MIRARRAVVILLIAIGLAVPPIGPVVVEAAARPDLSLVEQLREEADRAVTLSEDPATGAIDFVSTRGDLSPRPTARSARTTASTVEAKASAYVDTYAPVFGATADQLRRDAVTRTPAGWTVDFEQTHRGIPVFGAKLRAHLDNDGDLTSVNGYVAPDLGLDITPQLDETQAAKKALGLVRARPAGTTGRLPQDLTAGVEVVRAELMIYRLGVLQGVAGESVLAWVVDVANDRTVRETVILDARTGKPVNRYSTVGHLEPDREVIQLYADEAEAAEVVWQEGDDWPVRSGRHPGTLSEDQQTAVQAAGRTYWLFANTFGRDSYDGAGAPMRTIVHDPATFCLDALWTGSATLFCAGLATDDIAAHEWAHAYTQHTAGLLYQWQSGAINEGLSDIWGETVDLISTIPHEAPTPRRSSDDELCSTTGGYPFVNVTMTAPVEAECLAVVANQDAPELPAGEITVVVGRDEDGTQRGCSPLVNADEVAGNWVLLDQVLPNEDPVCRHDVQERHAIEAGAVGFISGTHPEIHYPFPMDRHDFTLPSFRIDTGSRDAITETGWGTLVLDPWRKAPHTDPSGRWVIAEDTSAPAARDMWHPTCYGDPGKVSDEEYRCTEADNGGVHHNSGVVNRTYALLVDGDTVDGDTIPGIGLDKAANIVWHAQTSYLTPTSRFPDLARALVQSCTDLVGTTGLHRLTIGDSPTGGSEATPEPLPPITDADCSAVAAATRATELESEPVQCDFQPVLDKETPAVCGEDYRTTTVWAEDFENGLDDWTLDHELFSHPTEPYAGQVHHPWVTTTEQPPVSGAHGGERPASTMAYAADPATGSCQGDADDESSRDGLTSPAIVVPDGASPTLSFDHYVATEATWDGGNVKVSVDDGPFELVSGGAYHFNAPGAALAPLEQGNTNPLAGQVAFSGTDQGEGGGSWGTSLIDLDAIADPGDSVRFRFDFGRDGCNGNDGWYLDDVRVTVCEEKVTPTVRILRPAKARAGKPTHLVVRVRGTGTRPRGDVIATEGGRTLTSATLNRVGVARMRLPGLSAGSHTIAVTYEGDAEHRSVRREFTLLVIRPSARHSGPPHGGRDVGS